VKPAELIQVSGHHELTLNARRAITILWHNAHYQGVAEGRDYTIEIDDLKSDGHKGYEMVVEAVEALMRTILTLRLPDGKTRRVQFLGGNDLDSEDRPAGVLTYMTFWMRDHARSMSGDLRKAADAAVAQRVEEAGITLVEMAIAFVIRHPAVTAAIIGPRTMEHLEAQLTAADVELSDELLDRIDAIVPPGVNVNPADTGWDNPDLAPEQRRR